MLTELRAATSTWAVRILFFVLVAAFATWGVGSDMLRLIGGRNDRAVAQVGSAEVSPEDFSREFSRTLNNYARRTGTEATPEQRRAIAGEVLSISVTQRALTSYEDALGLSTADDQVVREVKSVPLFLDATTHQFDRARFEEAIRARGVNEPQFMALVRADELNRQLLTSVRAGADVPDALARQVFAFEEERRAADTALVRFDATTPPAPTEAERTRWYENHPATYSTPEYRRVKLVALSPEQVAKSIDVTDEEVAAAFAEHRGEFQKPEARSAEIVATDNAALAQNIATAWRAGAGWDAIQKLAEGHGSAVARGDATAREFPDSALAAAVFAAREGSVEGPAPASGGFRVLRVGHVRPGSATDLAAATPELRTRIAAERAASAVYERASKLDELLGGGASLDEMPADLGLTGSEGTLDAKGLTAEGTPAPLPGPAALRDAIVADAFQTPQGEPPRMQEVKLSARGDQAYYALVVEDVTPPRVKPPAEVSAQVTADIAADRRRRAADEAATALRVAVQGGQPIADAAKVAHVAVTRLPPSGRAQPGRDVPDALLGPLFAATANDPAVIETAAGFLVAVPVDVAPGNPDADPIGFGQMRASLAQAIASDIAVLFEQALRARTPPTVNQALFDQIVTK